MTTFIITNPGTGYLANTGTAYPTSDITGTGSGFTVDITGVSSTSSGVTGAVREESYTFENDGGQPYQHEAWLAGLAPGYVLLALPIQTVAYVKINGSPVPVYPLSGGFQGGFAYYWFDGDAQARVIFPEGGLPSIGDVIVIGYIPVFQNSTVQGGDPLTNTCGSGIVEGVIQVPNIDVQTQLDAIAAAFLLARGTSIPVLVSYETDEQGLAVGQKQSIDLPLVGLGSTYIYITSVTFAVDSGNNRGAAKLPGGSAFRCTVEASTQNSNIGNWINWVERFIARTNFLLPLPRYEQAIAVLASGGALAAANPVPTDAYEAKNAGLVFAVSANAVVPPSGQNLLLQWLVNGVPLLKSPLIIPSGVSAIVYATAAQIPPGFAIYKGDLFTCSAAYQVTTGSPVAAGSVSLYCDWSY